MDKKIFREVSLEKLSSPDQLDQLIKVTSPRSWLALLGIALVLFSIIFWSIFGSLPSKIDGQGILLNNGGVYSIQHFTSGQVLDVRYKSGDMVNKGDVIARIDIPELTTEINRLQKEGNPVEDLREELIYKSHIVSPISGRILEMNIFKGNIIQPGETLVVLEQEDNTVRLEAVMYVSGEEGGKIKVGMESQISPATVNKEEYGFMLGRVVSVSDYPATTQSMMQTLGNENLVTMLRGQGVPIKVVIDLISDGNTKSGYKWSSPEGPPMLIHSGTLINGSVVVNRERPIEKVIRWKE